MGQMISVVVPVYNCKEYLRKCIQSILNQSYQTLQVILVDDGSTDGSDKICDEFVQQDRRVLVKHQPNGGVSKARNAGLSCVEGAWILFVDSDDYLHPEYCSRMLCAADQYDADVVIARPTADQLPNIQNYNLDEIELLKKTCLAYDETKFDYNIDGPWGKLFRRSIIMNNEIVFPETLSRSEDAYFCATVYEHATNICCLNWFGYVHVEREGSLCRRFAPDAPEMLERILVENHKWVQRYHPSNAEYDSALWYRVLPGIDECEHVYFLHDDNQEPIWSKLISYNRFLNKGQIKQAIGNLQMKNVPIRQYKIRLLFYKMHLGWLFLILKIVKKVVELDGEH